MDILKSIVGGDGLETCKIWNVNYCKMRVHPKCNFMTCLWLPPEASPLLRVPGDPREFQPSSYFHFYIHPIIKVHQGLKVFLVSYPRFSDTASLEHGKKVNWFYHIDRKKNILNHFWLNTEVYSYKYDMIQNRSPLSLCHISINSPAAALVSCGTISMCEAATATSLYSDCTEGCLVDLFKNN